MAQEPAVHVVVADLDDALGGERDELLLAGRVPAVAVALLCSARPTGARRRRSGAGATRPAARAGAPSGTRPSRRSGAARRRTAPTAVRLAVGVEPEQQRADRLRLGLVQAEAADDAVRRALVLDLEHRARVRLIRVLGVLGDDAVQAGALEVLEPAGGERLVARERRDVERRRGAGQRGLQRGAALPERPRLQVLGPASRSKAMKLAGVSAASRSTRLAAGCTRCWSAKKSRRRPVMTTISPSRTQRSGSCARNAASRSGK